MQLLTRKEVQKYTRLSSSALYRAIEKGILKPVKIFGKPLFIKEDIDKIIKQSLRNA